MSEHDGIDKNVKRVILSEIFFNLLPAVILIIVLLSKDSFMDVLKGSDLSFISSIFFGQEIVRFSSGLTKHEGKKSWQFIALVLTMIIVFGLAPSITVLVLIESSASTSLLLGVLQLLLFVISIGSYYVIGCLGQSYLERK